MVRFVFLGSVFVAHTLPFPTPANFKAFFYVILACHIEGGFRLYSFQTIFSWLRQVMFYPFGSQPFSFVFLLKLYVLLHFPPSPPSVRL